VLYFKIKEGVETYLHWNITMVTKMHVSTAIRTIPKVITFRNVLYPVVKILRVRNSMESLVQVLATPKRIWLASESCRPADTLSSGTSQA
jgi:alpha-D-ribose 1-methylphosphonate 5-triphosphate synthase subunit PhnL